MTAPVGTESRASFREVETDLQIVGRDTVADGVIALTLASPDGAELPEWSAGAHIDLLLPDVVRQYSLCGDTRDRSTWRIGVLRDPASRGGSAYIHDQLHEGTTVRVRGPRNHFPLVHSPRYVFIAGGIGITPLLPMIDAADTVGAHWELHYVGRTRASMGFLAELARYGDRAIVRPRDEQDRLDLDDLLGTPRPDTVVYCCGPERLLTAVESACGAWSPGSAHVERFAAKETDEPAATAAFEVECQRSGVTVTVPPDRSIYQAVEAAGIDVLGSCMEGVCGTCECDVIEGLPDHRDSVLSETERESGETILICVSRARSERLVLDL